MNHNPSPETVVDDVPGAPDADRRLRDAFAEAAYGFTPPPVPLAAIERDGRRRRRRRRAALVSAGIGLLLAPLAVFTLRLTVASAEPASEHVRPPATSPSAPSQSPTDSPRAGKVRVVKPGQRVTAADGTEIWLTEEGKFWQLPDETDAEPRFRSVVDGNLDMSTPNITLQEQGSGDGTYFLSGVYVGKGEAARVEITTVSGRPIDGTVLRLAGNEKWGAWYATTPALDSVPQTSDFAGITGHVTVYDAADRVIADQDFTL
ncbi:hypothetical protein ACFS5L_33320 [Streptomyces phyllanthi]|uniref:Uncharacterized protein n=1 Tax=Streptomyces phyllanthi TaxID=1803180 RepID=A0A5N8WIS5_9ACTN|nr:hypothetical protein [Streptomyces phyllanthi]MPY46992.1 hypothetical protein [Streptomyces phyllanthi]